MAELEKSVEAKDQEMNTLMSEMEQVYQLQINMSTQRNASEAKLKDLEQKFLTFRK